MDECAHGQLFAERTELRGKERLNLTVTGVRGPSGKSPATANEKRAFRAGVSPGRPRTEDRGGWLVPDVEKSPAQA